MNGDIEKKLLNMILWNLPEMKIDLCDKVIYNKLGGQQHTVSSAASNSLNLNW